MPSGLRSPRRRATPCRWAHDRADLRRPESSRRLLRARDRADRACSAGSSRPPSQNIRAYESERRTVEELRRLSTMRADFVSLVSHELRSPMAAVIGAARTLQQRWRELSSEQREVFLALIADETTRLAALIGDVLDTSRIDAGTFSYRFCGFDLAGLVRRLGRDGRARPRRGAVSSSMVRGCRRSAATVPACARCSNLIDNAVKYSPAGTAVDVDVRQSNGRSWSLSPTTGRGSPADDQHLIFEKFGRARRHARSRDRARPLHRALDRRGARRHARRGVRRRAAARRSR